MSQYSLQLLNAEKYLEEFEDIIIYNFENYLMQKRFRVGNGVENQDELNHALIFSDILCTDNCVLTKYIQDSIDGKLQNSPKKKSINKLIETFSKENNCTEEQACEATLFWTESMW